MAHARRARSSELVPQLAAAGREDDVRARLLDYRWIETKLTHTNIHLLLADYDEMLLEREEPARLVAGALKLSSHVLAVRPKEITSQLLGRISDFGDPTIQALIKEARSGLRLPALVPVWRSLTPPGEQLVRTIALGGSPVGRESHATGEPPSSASGREGRYSTLIQAT